MPSNNKTPNFGLNQWEGNEYPRRTDFVEDNAKVDTALHEQAEQIAAFANELENLAGAAGNSEPKIAAGTTSQFWRGDKTWQDIAAAVRGVVLTGLSTATNAAVAAADTLLVAIGKIQAQITAVKATADGAIPKSDISAATGCTLPLSRGGTNATDAAGARSQLGITPANIGAATSAQGATADAAIPKSNIAAATGGTLPLARGGTNATDAAGARAQLGITPANIGALPTSPESIEISGPTPYIDFHFNRSAADYTSRIIETASGVLSVESTFVAQANANYTTRQVRNVVESTADPSGGSNGDIWLKYV